MPARSKPKRPSFERSFTKDKREEFLQQVRMGMQRGAACDAVFGENNPTRRKELRDFIDGHPDFSEMVAHAELDATELVQDALFQAAVSGSVPAAKTWLEMKGVDFPEHRGRPSLPKPSDPESESPFGDLANVAVLNPRGRRSHRET